MAILRFFVGSFFRDEANDLKAHENVVLLGDADQVCDEPPRVAVRIRASVAPANIGIGADARYGLVGRYSSETTSQPESRDEVAWAGLERHQTLGQLMTETRVQRGLSREQVASQTHIPGYYVKVIESDNYDAIPDQLYLLPFFRRYAIFLGLDAQRVVLRFIDDFEKAENEASEPSAPGAIAPMAYPAWRQVALAALAMGIVLMAIEWRVETPSGTFRRPDDQSSAVNTAVNMLPPSRILSSDALPAAIAQQSPPVSTAASSSDATTITRLGSQTDSQHTQLKQTRRRSHFHVRSHRFRR